MTMKILQIQKEETLNINQKQKWKIIIQEITLNRVRYIKEIFLNQNIIYLSKKIKIMKEE